MNLYHYVPENNDVSKVGILSASARPEELMKYANRAGSQNPEDILAWLEGTFEGRSRAVSVLTEPVQTEGTDPMLAKWVADKQVVCIDKNRLWQSGLVDSVWCKEGSLSGGKNERIYQVNIDQIDDSPLSWHLCSKEKGLFFGVVRHYFLVMKNGVIPPEFCRVDKK